MLQLSNTLLNRPIMSLRTGTQVATVTTPIINPNNLKIEGFYCIDRFTNEQLVLLYQDIRDLIPQGFVINDHDVLSQPNELVRLKKILNLNFELVGKPIQTISGKKVGKVADYATEVSTMYVQKIYAAQSIFKSLTGGSLSIDRSQINEITNKRIVINEIEGSSPAIAPAAI